MHSAASPAFWGTMYTATLTQWAVSSMLKAPRMFSEDASLSHPVLIIKSNPREKLTGESRVLWDALSLSQRVRAFAKIEPGARPTWRTNGVNRDLVAESHSGIFS